MGEALGCGEKRWAQRIFDHACTLALLLVVAYTAAVWSARDSLARFLSGGVPEVQAASQRWTRSGPISGRHLNFSTAGMERITRLKRI